MKGKFNHLGLEALGVSPAFVGSVLSAAGESGLIPLLHTIVTPSEAVDALPVGLGNDPASYVDRFHRLLKRSCVDIPPSVEAVAPRSTDRRANRQDAHLYFTEVGSAMGEVGRAYEGTRPDIELLLDVEQNSFADVDMRWVLWSLAQRRQVLRSMGRFNRVFEVQRECFNLHRLQQYLNLSSLRAVQVTKLFYAYYKQGNTKTDGKTGWERAINLYSSVASLPEQSRQAHAFLTADKVLEYLMVATNKMADKNPQSLARTLAITAPYINKDTATDEVLAQVGKAHKLRYDAARAFLYEPEDQCAQERFLDFFPREATDYDNVRRVMREELQLAYESYHTAFTNRSWAHYPGIPASYLAHTMGKLDEAKYMARMVYESTLALGGLSAKDYWALASLMEAATIAGLTDEIEKILPRVVEVAHADWEIGTTMNWLGNFAREQEAALTLARRNNPSLETPANIQVTRRVMSVLRERAQIAAKPLIEELAKSRNEQDTSKIESLKEVYLTGFPRDYTLAQIEANMHRVLVETVEDPNVSSSLQHRVEAGTKLSNFSLNFAIGRDIATGNVPFGGLVPDITTNREDTRIYRQQMEDMGLFDIGNGWQTAEDLEAAYWTMSNRLSAHHDKMFRLTDPYGHRWLEDLSSERHESHIDRYWKNLNGLVGCKTLGESATNMAAAEAVGVGDCRHVNMAAASKKGMWWQEKIYREMNAAYACLKANNITGFQRNMDRIRILGRFEVRVFNFTVHANVQLGEGGKYDIRRDANGVPVYSPDVNELEDHTTAALVIHDYIDRGSSTYRVPARIVIDDDWYQEEYAWKGLEIPRAIETLDRMHAGTIITTEGDVDIALTFAIHSEIAAKLNTHSDDYSQVRYTGMNFSSPTPGVMRGNRAALDRFVEAVVGNGEVSAAELERLMRDAARDSR